MMIVVTLIALVAGLSYPTLSSGLETLRLRSASDAIISMLNTAVERADRRQQAVQIQIDAHNGIIQATSADGAFNKRIEIAPPLSITDVLPHTPSSFEPTRRILVYPGGSPPRVGIELSTIAGRKRLVSIDPITGVPEAR
jgi:type II secretory pathway pseudopilin PulG